jgi:hypothetical protein
MILFNTVLVLAAILVASLLLGSIFSNQKSFGGVIRRGVTILIAFALLATVLLAISDNPTILQRIADFFQQLMEI